MPATEKSIEMTHKILKMKKGKPAGAGRMIAYK
jgi:hypothetical protein